MRIYDCLDLVSKGGKLFKKRLSSASALALSLLSVPLHAERRGLQVLYPAVDDGPRDAGASSNVREIEMTSGLSHGRDDKSVCPFVELPLEVFEECLGVNEVKLSLIPLAVFHARNDSTEKVLRANKCKSYFLVSP